MMTPEGDVARQHLSVNVAVPCNSSTQQLTLSAAMCRIHMRVIQALDPRAHRRAASNAGKLNLPAPNRYKPMRRCITNPCYRRLAQVAGLPYHTDNFEADGDGFVHDRAWRCDLAIVLGRLRRFRKEIAVHHAPPIRASQ
jgi:hypothetical protein